MNAIEIFYNLFQPKYYYILDFDKEKYSTWLNNRFSWDTERYEGYVASWGFYYAEKPPFFTMIYEKRFKGEVRGEFIQSANSLLLKIEVLIDNPTPILIFIPLGLIFIWLKFKNVVFSVLSALFCLLMAYESFRVKVYKGSKMVKEIEDLLELKKISKEEFNRYINP